MSISHEGTKIEMSYQTFRSMEQAIREKDAQIQALKDAQIQALRQDRSSTQKTIPNEQPIVETLNHAIKVIQFAISELDPATVRGWPWPALEDFGQGLKGILPTPSAQAFADTCVAFAGDCRATDAFRTQREQEAKAVLGIDEE